MPTDTGAPWSLPTPLAPEAPDGPGNLASLATSMHNALGRAYPCLSTSRPSPVAGLLIFETDTLLLQVSDGTNWLPLYFAGGAPLGRMYRTANQTLTTGVTTKLAFNLADTASRGITCDTTTNNGFVVTRAGRYKLACSVPFVANATGFRLVVIEQNGVIVASSYVPPETGTVTIIQCSTVWPILCAVNDVLTVFAAQNSGANLDVTNANGTSFEFAAEWRSPS
jgi:hypothetical protein